MPNNRNYGFSDETQAIISGMPKGIAVWGSTILFGILIVLITISCLVSYPQTLKVVATINSHKAQNIIFAKQDIALDTVLVADGTWVKDADVIAVYKNTARYKDIQKVKAAVQALTIKASFSPDFKLQLGDVTPQYLGFAASWNNAKKDNDELLFQKSRYDLLRSCDEWATKYVIKAPNNGYLVWLKTEPQNHSLPIGTPLFSITADDIEPSYCQLLIPEIYINQVKIGQTALIDWNNQSIPLRSRITNIAAVPNEKNYLVSVVFDEPTESLIESPPTKVAAELVIQDARLIEYLFQPIKLFFEKQKQNKQNAVETETPKLVKYTGH